MRPDRLVRHRHRAARGSPARGGEGVTVTVIRSSVALPRTRTVIRAGAITVPWTMPTELDQRRRCRLEYRPLVCEETP